MRERAAQHSPPSRYHRARCALCDTVKVPAEYIKIVVTLKPSSLPGKRRSPRNALITPQAKCRREPPVFSAGDPTPTCMGNFGWLSTCPKKAFLKVHRLLPIDGEKARSSG